MRDRPESEADRGADGQPDRRRRRRPTGPERGPDRAAKRHADQLVAALIAPSRPMAGGDDGADLHDLRARTRPPPCLKKRPTAATKSASASHVKVDAHGELRLVRSAVLGSAGSLRLRVPPCPGDDLPQQRRQIRRAARVVDLQRRSPSPSGSWASRQLRIVWLDDEHRDVPTTKMSNGSAFDAEHVITWRGLQQS